MTRHDRRPTCATCGRRTRFLGSHALAEHSRPDASPDERLAAVAAARGRHRTYCLSCAAPVLVAGDIEALCATCRP